MTLYYRFIFRALFLRPGRTLLTIIGVALGIAVVGAIHLANVGSLGAFRESMRHLAGQGSLSISAEGRKLSAEDLSTLGWLTQFGILTPAIEDVLWFERPGHERELLRVTGLEPISLAASGQLASVITERKDVQGTFFANVRDLARQDHVFVTEDFARRNSLTVGSIVEAVHGDRLLNLKVAGIVTPEGRGKIEASPRIFMDIASAQSMLGRLSTANGSPLFDQLDLVVDKHLSVSQVRKEISSRLPSDYFISSGEDEYAQVEQLTKAFHFNLNCLASLALIVGLFLIHNTITTSTILRRREIAILRSLGTSRGTVIALFLVESSVYAVIGCLFGFIVAKLLAPSLIAGTKVTMSTFFVSEAAVAAVSSVSLPFWWSVFALLACVALACFTAYFPASQAACEPIVPVLRGDLPEKESSSLSLLRLVCFLLFILCGYFSSGIGPVFDLPVFGFLSVIMFIAATAVIARPVAETVSRIFVLLTKYIPSPLKTFVSISAGQALAGMRRIAVAVGALAVSIGMMVAIAVLIESFRSTIVVWIDQTLRADLFVRSLSRTSPTTQVYLSPELAQWIRSRAEVESLSELTTVPLKYGDSPIYLNITDLRVPARYGALVWKESPASLEFEGKTFISESMALRERLRVGDRFELPFLKDSKNRTVDGIFYDYSNTRGVVFIDTREYLKIHPNTDLLPTNLAVYLKPNSVAEDFAAQLREYFGSKLLLSIQSRHALKADALRIFDSTFAITYTLEIIALIVAGIGVLVTQLTLFFERLKEFGIFQSLGFSRPQIATVLGLGGLLTGLSSQFLGILLGFCISLVLIYVVNVQSFGWTIQFQLPWLFILQLSVALLLVATLLGSLPVLWLRRRTVVEVLREE